MALTQMTVFVGIVLSTMVKTTRCVPTVNDSLPGQPLTEMGKRLHIPHLQLTGEVINHLADDLRKEMAEICRLHPCSLWTTWSRCDFNEPGKYGQYGSSKRTRNCGFNTTLCKRYGDRNMEHDRRICKCKDGFTVTKHDYCLKYFGIPLDHYKAKSACQKEGGYLANSGSAKKMEDMNAYIMKVSSSSYFWVDGQKSASGKWDFEIKPENVSFGDWYRSKVYSSACKAHYRSGKWLMCELSCSTRYPYMCEILA